MRVQGTALIADYREGVKEKVDPDTGTVERRPWAMLETSDGMALFCDQGTLSEADTLGTMGKAGVVHLRCRLDLDVKQKGRATFVDLRAIEVLGTVEV